MLDHAIATVALKAIPGSPYSSSRAHDLPKLKGEQPAAYDERTWKDKLHFDADGQCFIPPFALQMAIIGGARRSLGKIPGKGNSTWGKLFEQGGLMVLENAYLGVHKDDVPGERFYVHANGKRGSGTRVWRRFPMIFDWEATVAVTVLNLEIDPDTLKSAITAAGLYTGLGRFRPENGGTNGRFQLKAFNWERKAADLAA